MPPGYAAMVIFWLPALVLAVLCGLCFHAEMYVLGSVSGFVAIVLVVVVALFHKLSEM